MPTSESLKTFSVSLDFSDLKKVYPDLNLDSENDRRTLVSTLKAKYLGTGIKMDISLNNNKVIMLWVIAKSSDEAEKLNREALSSARQKNYNKALSLWQRALELNPNDPDFHYNVGLVYFESKDVGKSLDKLLETIRICPVYTRAYFVLGSIYSKMRKFQQAEKYLTEGLLLQNNNVLAYVNLGAIYSILRFHKQAIHSFERAIAIAPRESRAYLGLGKVYVALNDFDNANRCFKAVLKMDPNGKLGDIARKSIRTISATEPSSASNTTLDADLDDSANIEELYSEGYQAFISGDYRTAASAYKRYLAKRTSEADVWASLASCQLRMGLTSEAIESIKRAIEYSPSKPAFHKEAAIIYDACSMPSEAAQAAQKAIELGKHDSITLSLVGKSYAIKGNFEESLRYLQEAVKMNPNNINARFHYAHVLKSLGQKEAAKQHFEEILWSKTESPLKDKARKEIQTLI